MCSTKVMLVSAIVGVYGIAVSKSEKQTDRR